MANEKMKKLLEMIDVKVEHIEDMTADNRAIIVKLVKQNNQIVDFLKQIEIEDITEKYEELDLPSPTTDNKLKYETVKELLDEFMDKQKDLEELEQELKKHKDKITPGQIGEA